MLHEVVRLGSEARLDLAVEVLKKLLAGIKTNMPVEKNASVGRVHKTNN